MQALHHVEAELPQEYRLLVSKLLKDSNFEFISLESELALRSHEQNQEYDVDNHASGFDCWEFERSAKVLENLLVHYYLLSVFILQKDSRDVDEVSEEKAHEENRKIDVGSTVHKL